LLPDFRLQFQSLAYEPNWQLDNWTINASGNACRLLCFVEEEKAKEFICVELWTSSLSCVPVSECKKLSSNHLLRHEPAASTFASAASIFASGAASVAEPQSC
jgi:hypothetical protein